MVEEPGAVPVGVTPDGRLPRWIHAVYDPLALDMDYFDSSRGSCCVVLIGLNDSFLQHLTAIR